MRLVLGKTVFLLINIPNTIHNCGVNSFNSFPVKNSSLHAGYAIGTTGLPPVYVYSYIYYVTLSHLRLKGNASLYN